jgi:hypothetical protein
MSRVSSGKLTPLRAQSSGKPGVDGATTYEYVVVSRY